MLALGQNQPLGSTATKSALCHVWKVPCWQELFSRLQHWSYRLAHTVNAFFITTAFVVIAVSSYHLRHEHFIAESRKMFWMTLWLATVLVPLQIVISDMHGTNTLAHQPAKIAAIEANWETQRRMPLLLFAIPDEAAEKNWFEVGIPVLGSITD
jgi:cytochrome bd ubiquinol oxidase subunit I